MKEYLLIILLITVSFTCGFLVHSVVSWIRNSGIVRKRIESIHPEQPEDEGSGSEQGCCQYLITE